MATRIYGCVHLLALPGSPDWGGSMSTVVDAALRDATALARGGVDGLVVENTRDSPYPRGAAEAATVAAMARVVGEIRRQFTGPIGVQVLAGADIEALDLAAALDLEFIRVEGFLFAHVADEGILQSDAARLMRRRASLAAKRVEIWADVKKKHAAHAVTADLSLRDVVEAAAWNGADAIVVTGSFTGRAPDRAEVASVRGLGPSVVVGSGVTPDNVAEFATLADALIVGSSLKRDGLWRNEVDERRVVALVRTARGES